jgi:hypothetical protein
VSAPVVQLRIPEDTLAQLDGHRSEETRSAWIVRLIDRELDGQAPTPGPPAVDTLTTSPPLAALANGEPSPGVLCMGPGCWERNTSKYGLRQVPALPCLPGSLRRPHPPAGDTARRGVHHAPRRSLTTPGEAVPLHRARR